MLGMVQEKYAIIYNKVMEAMENDKLFLRADLSLKLLSRVVGTNTVYLSKTINEGFGCGYSTLVNRYRVEYIIKETLNSGEDIAAVAQRLGFWSRATFYSVFQQMKNETPQRYIHNALAGQKTKKDESMKYEVKPI